MYKLHGKLRNVTVILSTLQTLVVAETALTIPVETDFVVLVGLKFVV